MGTCTSFRRVKSNVHESVIFRRGDSRLPIPYRAQRARPEGLHYGVPFGYNEQAYQVKVSGMPVFVWSSVEDIEDPRRKNLCSTEPYAAIIRAQSELRSLIKQYDELLHKRWDLASEEQKARIGQLGAQADKLR